MDIEELERIACAIPEGLTTSEREAWLKARWPEDTMALWRPHRYVGGTPPRRIYHMQLAHETRARKAGVKWDTVDLRIVYARDKGICGICKQEVSLSGFTIDHIKPLTLGGSHTIDNLQIAHRSCNSSKGDRYDG